MKLLISLLILSFTLPVLAEKEPFKWSLDLRYRFQAKDDESVSQYIDNSNQLMARLGLYARVDDHFDVFLRMATGTGNPASTNQSLGNDGDLGGKNFNLDRAYVLWQGVESLRISAGKIENIFHRPGRSQLVWDNDFNPEGVGINYNYKFGDSGYQLDWKTAQYLVDTSTNDATFPTMLGMQLVLTHSNPLNSIKVNAVGYQYLDFESRPVFGTVNTNTQSGGAYLFNYNLLGGGIEWRHEGWGIPVAMFGDYIENQVVQRDNTAHQSGFSIGDFRKAYQWGTKIVYREIGQDATVDLFPDAAFMGGGTNNRGIRAVVGYKPTDNSWVAIRYFTGERGIGSGDTRTDFESLQTELMVRY